MQVNHNKYTSTSILKLGVISKLNRVKSELLSVNSDAMAIPSIAASHQYPARIPIADITTPLRSMTCP